MAGFNSKLMNDAYSELNNRSITGDLQLMPANDLRIDFNVLQNYSRNYVQGGYNVVENNYRGYRDAFGTELITYSILPGHSIQLSKMAQLFIRL